MYQIRRSFTSLLLLVTGLILVGTTQAETRFFKPYVLAKQSTGNLTDVLEETRVALKQGGMTIVGEYSPYPGAHSLVVTNEGLKQAATRSELGGYGAALRVGVTKTDEGVQIAYTNPEYMAIVYRMADSLAGVTSSMAGALGRMQEFGSEHGTPEFDLKSYHYMIFMPYFTDQLALAEYDSYDSAVQAVESGLAAGRSGTQRVYRIDLPGKDETLFGVAFSAGEGSDQAVMATTDIAPLKHTPHLPYEMLVSGGKVYALHGKFRIAQSFPDLTMGTFMKISKAPDAIEAALQDVAGRQ